MDKILNNLGLGHLNALSLGYLIQAANMTSCAMMLYLPTALLFLLLCFLFLTMLHHDLFHCLLQAKHGM